MDRISASLVRFLPIGVVVYRVVDPHHFENTIADKANDAAAHILKNALPGTLGRAIKDIPVIPQNIRDGLEAAYRTHQTIYMDETQLEGLPGWFHVRIFRLDDTEYVVETIEDISNIKAMDGRYQAFVKATPDMLHLVCRDGKFVNTHVGTVPPIAPPSEYIGKTVYEVFEKDFADQAMALINKTLDTEEVQEWDYELPQIPDHHFNCRFSKSGVNEVLLVIRDTTAIRQVRSQLEEAVRERTSQLEHSNQALQSFVYAASHDLREPLSKITAFGTRLKDTQKTLDAKGLEYLDVMLKAADRLTDLIDDLLTFSRLGEKDATPPVWVDTGKVLCEVLSDLCVSLETSHAKVTIQPEMPKILAHPMRVRQIFQNLISNGLKFHKPNQNPIIRIGGRVVDGNAVFTVADDGIGFDPEFKEKIFTVFTRLHTRFEYPGTGLGLALCRRIVGLYGGTITADGRPDEGAVFTLTFPLPLEQ